MRQLKDKNGIEVYIESILGENAYAHWLGEGPAFLARRLWLSRAQHLAEQPGHYFHHLEELQRAVQPERRDDETWPPAERWTAKLVGKTDWGRERRPFLNICWHQKGGDPMAFLGDIVSHLDFQQYCMEEDDSFE